MKQIPDHHLQPDDPPERCPNCGEDMFIDGYCSYCRYEESFEAECDKFDNKNK